MDREAFFWKIHDGKLPPPRAAETLGIRFTKIDAEASTPSRATSSRRCSTTPWAPRSRQRYKWVRRGRDVCFLSAELFQAGELVATATATALVRKLP